jgi:hypothetical protein
MDNKFPAIGKFYRVDFVAFQVILNFTSMTSMTYTNLDKFGRPDGHETVTVKIEPIGDQSFLVTWQESDKTTVVHIENYQAQTIITNITNPDLSFDQYHGTFTEVSAPA